MSESKFKKDALTAAYRCEEYNVENIKKVISEMAQKISVTGEDVRDKKIVIKPNLVLKKDPSSGATTHPAVLEGVILWLNSIGVPSSNITIAESPGGPYTESSLKTVYKICGIEEVALKLGANLNYDTSSKQVSYPSGKISRLFSVITPISDADIIINICKLKSHALTGMSAAVKNLFGIVPGTQKFEMHARYPDLTDFAQMLNDLCLWLHEQKQVISICDGIIGMEGNGPTSGTPRKIGVLMMSENPFALDMAASHIISAGDSVKMLDFAKERSLIPKTLSELNICGEEISALTIKDFKKSDADGGKFFKALPNIMGGRFLKFVEPKPQIDKKKCIGCSECVRSCPVNTITIEKTNKKRIAVIHLEKCIKCFCCQELCPHSAVKIKKNILLRIIR